MREAKEQEEMREAKEQEEMREAKEQSKVVSEKNVRWSDPSCYLTGNGTSGGWDGSEDKWDKARTPTRNSITYFSWL